MNLNPLFIHTSYFFISITCINSYVLVATNADDFRSIAKIIPNQLADKLAEMASKSAKNYDQDLTEDSEESDDSNQEEDVSSSSPYPQYQVPHKNRFGVEKQFGNLDFNELVRRVREQLENEYRTSTFAKSFAKPEKSKMNDDYNYKDNNPSGRWTNQAENEQVQGMPLYAFTSQKQQYVGHNEANAHEEYIDENENVRQVAPQNIKNENLAKHDNKKLRQDTPNNMKNVKGVQYVEGNTEGAKEYYENNGNNAPEYYEDNTEGTQDTLPAVDVDTFKKVDMFKSKDSYEDYVAPARDNIFASDEVTLTTAMKPIKGVQRYVAPSRTKYNQNNSPKTAADVYVKNENFDTSNLNAGYINKDNVVTPARVLLKGMQSQQSDIKAITKSVWYKDANFQNYDDSKTTTLVPIGGKSSTKRKNVRGTMFLTRFHLKISSPNYIAKLPAVAEKYNFNEPIPEKDREHENIKHIGNPPALINKKIRI